MHVVKTEDLVKIIRQSTWNNPITLIAAVSSLLNPLRCVSKT